MKSIIVSTTAITLLAILAAWSTTLGTAIAANTSVGLDFNPTGTPANGVYNPVSLPTFETCREVVVGQSVSIDVFALDVETLAAFSADLLFDESKIRANSSSVNLFMGSQVGSSMVNDSTPLPEGISFQPSATTTNTETAVDTTIEYTSTGDPIAVSDYIRIDNEWILVNAVNTVGNTLTVTRGQLGTTAAAHNPSGKVIYERFSDGLVEVAGHDDGNISGDTGYGVLGRITFLGLAAGTSAVSIPSIDGNGDTVLDTGVTLRQASGALINDGNSDGLYDGPWTPGPGLPAGQIVVGQDTDADGIMSNVCTGSPDNCPSVANPSQANLDGDTEGDACDGDADNDKYWNNVVSIGAHEQTMGSNMNSITSTPEVCDGVNNDGDGSTDEGFDYNANTVPDCVDGAANTDGDGLANPTDLDDDGDGWTDVHENFAGTNSLKKCPVDTTVPLDDYFWTPDNNNDKRVNIQDVVRFGPYFNSAATGATQYKYNKRFDMNASNGVNISDIIILGPVFNLPPCTP